MSNTHDDTKVDKAAVDADTELAADSNNLLSTQKAVRMFVDGRMRKTYVNGNLKTNVLDWTDSVMTSGGNATFYITNDRTSGGTAMATALYADTIQVNYIDSSGVYSTGTPVVSGDFKTVTIPISKQSFTGLTVLGLNVLGAASQGSIPDGVKVKMQIIGAAA